MPRARKSPSTQASSVRPLAAAIPIRERIRGIHLDVPGRELAVRLTERIRWHRERADLLISQMKKLVDVEREAADDLVGLLGRYESPRVALEKKVRDHQERASFLTFVRDHVSPDEIYRLDSMDLKMTEILPDRP